MRLSHRLDQRRVRLGLKQVQDAVLSGFSVFTPDDARRAGECLLQHGSVGVKPTRETGGRGQRVVFERAELGAMIAATDTAKLSSDGLVLEENLSEVTTFSVGQVRVAELVATYYGSQQLTSDNSGATVYGGSELVIARGDFNALLGLQLPDEVRRAIAQARAYDAATTDVFPAMFASRRNYDIAQGFDAAGQWRSGVLEQSWRLGGASGAEIAALEAFKAEPLLQALRVFCIELYGACETPPHATVYFQGTDEQVGPITKYTLVEPHAGPR